MDKASALLICTTFLLTACGSDGVSNQNHSSSEFTLQTSSVNDFMIVATMENGLLQELYYSNEHNFHVDKSGDVIDSEGRYLLVFPTNPDGSVSSVSLASSQPLNLYSTDVEVNPTENILMGFNLPAQATVPSIDTVPFASFEESCGSDSGVYNSSTSVTVYDSLASTHTLSVYFAKTLENENTWQIRAALTSEEGGCQVLQTEDSQLVDFNPLGLIDLNDEDMDGQWTINGGAIRYQSNDLVSGAAPLDFVISFELTSYQTPFEVSASEQDGGVRPEPTSFSISADGLIQINYPEGWMSKLVGKVVLAKFAAPYYLAQESDSLWLPTSESGDASVIESEVETVSYQF